ncbi:MAG: SpoIIE family protein phosphatase [Eubacteriales bacterium]
MKTRRIPRDKRGLLFGVGTFFQRSAERASVTLGKITKEYSPALFCKNLIFAGTSFLLGCAEVWFSASPLGVAWLCAAPVGVPYILIGLCLSALTKGEEALVYLLGAAFAFGIRIIVRCVIEPPRGERISEALFRESTHLRMATAAVSAFAVGFYRAFVSGFYLYDLGSCITATVLAPVATALYIPIFAENADEMPDEESPFAKILPETSYIALQFSLALAASALEITGMSPVHIAITASILYTVRTRGAMRGVIVGALCGAVAGLDFAVVYAAGAAAASMFMNLSLLAAATTIPICGALRSAFFSDAEGFISLFPSQVAGLAIFCLISLLSERLEFSASGVKAGQAQPGNPLQARQRMKDLSSAFSGLADSFAELAKTRRRPAESELRAACDKVCDRVCLKCPNKNLCWNLEYASTLDIVSKMCSSVTKKGYIETSDLPEYMRRRCPSLDKITDGVNTAATELIRACLEDERLSGFSADYRAVSAALAEAVDEDLRENSEDVERTERVRRVLNGAGVKFSSLSVIGKRRVTIKAENVNLSRATVKAEELRRQLEKAVGCLLSPPMLIPESSAVCLEFTARRRYCVTFGAARSSADPSDPCGDSICRIDSEDDYFYAVICDGMGQGRGAAFASGASIGFLKQMLSAKMSVETSLSVLNAWLRADREECSVSIDILKIDLLTGKAAIYKSGAAASFLHRGRDVFPIESEGFPVGILKQTAAIRTDLELREGDVIMMGSDGIDPDCRISRGEEVWLLDLIESVKADVPDSVNEAAARTVKAARSAGSSDDIGAVYVALRAEPFEAV